MVKLCFKVTNVKSVFVWIVSFICCKCLIFWVAMFWKLQYSLCIYICIWRLCENTSI